MEASKERARLIALGAIRPAAKKGAPPTEEGDPFSREVIELVAAANRQIERSASRRNWAKLEAGEKQYEHEPKRRWR